MEVALTHFVTNITTLIANRGWFITYATSDSDIYR